jgi:alpha-glucosidase
MRLERDEFMKRLCAVVVASWMIVSGSPAFAEPGVVVKSPDDRIRFELIPGEAHLAYAIRMADRPVLAASPLGIVVDGVDLGQGAELGRVETSEVDESYPTRGGHSRAVNRYRGARVSARHAKSGADFAIDVRVFNDGVAFRYLVPGEGRERVPDEATAFQLVAGSTVWYHDLRGHYEGVHFEKPIAEVKAGEWAGPPLTIKLPQGLGYAAITEGSLIGYAGMALEADGNAGFAARLGHAHPASHPYTLRYGEEEAKRLAKPATIRGTITTPWRVVMIGPDLNTLVNCDIVSNVSPPPDPRYFPQGLATDWIKPGRSLWKYLDGGPSTLDGMKEFSRLAGELGFEYNLIEGFWQRWSEADLRAFVEESKARGVGIFLWKHSREIKDPTTRRDFFRKCREAGVAGVKLDFFDHEAKEVVELYEAALRDAAEFHLMVDFHGANKPAGESRTWPNEMTREGIYGLEHRGPIDWARHNTTLPFTRMLAGHADYTPVHFGERRRETSWAHQIATAAAATSPLLVYAANPKNLLANPAVEMIKSIPSVWDETIVLPVSEIGQIAALARRNGDRWFLVILNGSQARTIRVPITFLGPGNHRALLVRDQKDDAAAVKLETITMSRDDSIDVDLRAGGGFVGRFDRP